MHRLVTLTVAFLQRWPTKLESQGNSYWFLTNSGRQSLSYPGAPRDDAQATIPGADRQRQKKQPTGEGHEKDSSQVDRPPPGAGSDRRPRRRVSEPDQGPVRQLPARTALHARPRPQV